MDKLTFIDMDHWDRAEYYRQFTEVWGSIYGNATKRIDVTATVKLCKEKGVKLVPVFLYLVAKAINSKQCFRFWMRDKRLCYWDKLHPMYSIGNDDGTLSYHATRYLPSFKEFYYAYLKEREENKNVKGLFAGVLPENVFSISVLPEYDYDSNSFSMGASKHRFMPIVVVGKFSGETAITMPVSITVCHATVNGSEVGDFFNMLVHDFANPLDWLDF